MGRRAAEATTTRNAGLKAITEGMLLPALAFVLEVAMVASLLYWGFRQPSPWNLVLGIGVPAAVVVLWGIFMAPKGVRRLPPAVVAWASLGVFVLAAAALVSAGAAALGVVMLAVTGVWFAASRFLQGP